MLIDRFIMRQYLVNIATLFVILFSFVVAVDVIINLDRFTRRADELVALSGDPEGGALRSAALTAVLIIDLWSPRLLQLFTYLNGIVLIVAMGFTASQMVRHRELVALLSCGVGLRRIARPFLIVALGMIALQVFTQERLIPPVAHLLTRDPGESGKREVESFPVLLAPDARGRLWYARAYDDGKRELQALRIWERREDGALARVISAPVATWTGAGWDLSTGRVSVPPSSSEEAPAPPRRLDRLPPDLDPETLKVRYRQGFAQSLSWWQLSEMRAALGGDTVAIERLDRIRWGRASGWVSGFLALCACLPLFLVKAPRAMIGPSLKAAPLALGGFVASAVASSASAPGLPVWLGAFIPCMILLSIAVALTTGIES